MPGAPAGVQLAGVHVARGLAMTVGMTLATIIARPWCKPGRLQRLFVLLAEALDDFESIGGSRHDVSPEWPVATIRP
ncbi:hypothetical protein [Lysobacter sp.]|uniref:hypothetical protein n=1 Tax=Lysobacter sp. TaxID=72226 RepID=UPI002D3F6AAD|nr:hypothetical protein [Lysobacter sp.]HZX76080.1 hypothetical protein [Lysobacter sp.]